MKGAIRGKWASFKDKERLWQLLTPPQKTKNSYGLIFLRVAQAPGEPIRFHGDQNQVPCALTWKSSCWGQEEMRMCKWWWVDPVETAEGSENFAPCCLSLISDQLTVLLCGVKALWLCPQSLSLPHWVRNMRLFNPDSLLQTISDDEHGLQHHCLKANTQQVFHSEESLWV